MIKYKEDKPSTTTYLIWQKTKFLTKLSNRFGFLLSRNFNVAWNRCNWIQWQRSNACLGVGLLKSSFSTLSSIIHQHGNSHGTHTTRNRRNCTGYFDCFREFDITNPSFAWFLGFIFSIMNTLIMGSKQDQLTRNSICTNINDHCTRLDPCSFDKFSFAYRHHQNVRWLDLVIWSRNCY